MGIFNSLFAGQINESERSMKRTQAREKEIAAYEEMRKI